MFHFSQSPWMKFTFVLVLLHVPRFDYHYPSTYLFSFLYLFHNLSWLAVTYNVFRCSCSSTINMTILQGMKFKLLEPSYPLFSWFTTLLIIPWLIASSRSASEDFASLHYGRALVRNFKPWVPLSIFNAPPQNLHYLPHFSTSQEHVPNR